MAKAGSTEKVVREIRRHTRRRFSAEEKIRIVLEGLRGEESIAEPLQHDPNLLFGREPPAGVPPNLPNHLLRRSCLRHGVPPPLAGKCLLLHDPTWSTFKAVFMIV